MPNDSTTQPKMQVTAWRPVAKNSLKGFVSVQLPSGVIIHDIAVHQKSDSTWTSPPSKPQIGRDGKPILRDGKPAYSPIIEFVDRSTRERFSQQVLAALAAAFPDALS